MTNGTIEIFSIMDRRLFQCVDADRISEALSSAMRHITLIMLISETPIVAKVLTTEVVLRVLVALTVVALIVLLTVLNIDDNILALLLIPFYSTLISVIMFSTELFCKLILFSLMYL